MQSSASSYFSLPFTHKSIIKPLQYAADHTEIHDQLNKLTQLCNSYKEGSTVDDLVVEMKKYQDMLLPHLLQEEEEALPLMRAYFVPAEIKKLTEEIMKDVDRVRSITSSSFF